MSQAIHFTSISTEYKGVKYAIPIPAFKAVLATADADYPLHLYLDTGSNGSMLFSYSLHLTYPHFLADTTDTAIDLLIKQLGELPLGINKRFRLDAEARLGEANETPICAGIIGTDLLKDYALCINYPSAQFFLESGEMPPLGNTCRFAFERNFLFLYAQVMGVQLKLLYDTGMGGPLLLFDRGFSKLPGNSFEASSREYAQGAFGATYYYDSYEQKMKLDFSPQLELETEFGVQEKHPLTDSIDCDGLLGNQLFMDREISINYPKRAFSFSDKRS